MKNAIITDRYSATGTPYPDENSCNECEAMGLYPCKAENLNEEACSSPEGRVLVIGQFAKDGSPMPNDGWLVIQCPVCNGSRRKPEAPQSKEGE